VRALAVPIALVHGAEDAISPPALVRAWLDALTAPSASLRVLDGVGHLPHVEAPAIVREVLAALS
jgi:pimeloyl-ACP methyl ester carboxylesterase